MSQGKKARQLRWVRSLGGYRQEILCSFSAEFEKRSGLEPQRPVLFGETPRATGSGRIMNQHGDSPMPHDLIQWATEKIVRHPALRCTAGIMNEYHLAQFRL